jgi:Mg2+-importing ATPase
LFWTTIAVALVTVTLPYTSLAALLGFQPLPIQFLMVLAAIVGLYIFSAEIVKRLFYQHIRT